jgi:hypothetical protein
VGLQLFVDRGGFKMLAVSRLSATAYGLVCYLMNCLVAGVEEVVCSTGELSILLGVPERLVKLALEELEASRIVSLKRSENAKTLVLRFQLDLELWQNLRIPQPSKRSHLGDARNIRSLRPQSQPDSRSETTFPQILEGSSETLSPGEVAKKLDFEGKIGLNSVQALMFPSSSERKSKLAIPIDGFEGSENQDVQRVIEAFQKSKGGALLSLKDNNYAMLLCENHSADQIVSLIETFGQEIPSLSMLAAAWVHYSDRFHEIGQEELSLSDYRKKSQVMERKLRQLANAELKKAQSFKMILSADEELLLRIFVRHPQPRRQLYWALQVAPRYPQLQLFFLSVKEMAVKPPQTKLKIKET